MSAPTPVDVTASNVHDKDTLQAEKLGVDVEEVVVTRISEEDLMRISRECLDIRSPTGWRIALITLVMGFNMAGYLCRRIPMHLTQPECLTFVTGMASTGE